MSSQERSCGQRENEMLRYCANLSATVSVAFTGEKCPAIMQPEDWVLNKDQRCHRWKQRRVQGPFQVLLTAETVEKVAQKVPWIHASHFKNFSEPYDDFSPAGPNLSSPPNENEGWSVCFLCI